MAITKTQLFHKLAGLKRSGRVRPMNSDTASTTFFFMPDFEATDRTAHALWSRAGVTSTQTRGLKWTKSKPASPGVR